MPSKESRYIRGAGGRFQGSTGGGGTFALTGGSRVGGKAGIKARAKLRVAKRRLFDAASQDRAAERLGFPLGSYMRPGLSRSTVERLASAIKRRREDVARIESGAPVAKRSTAEKLHAALTRQSKQAQIASKAKAERSSLMRAFAAGKTVSAAKVGGLERAAKLGERRAARAQKLIERLRARKS